MKLKEKPAQIHFSEETKKKLEDMFFACRTVAAEHISDEEELKKRLKDVGIEISKTKKKIEKNDEDRKDMQAAADLVTELKAKNTSEDRIRDIRSILTNYRIYSDEDIEKVNDRFKECKRLENDFNERLNVLNKQYAILKKVEYQAKLARSRDYCYGYERGDEHNERVR